MEKEPKVRKPRKPRATKAKATPEEKKPEPRGGRAKRQDGGKSAQPKIKSGDVYSWNGERFAAVTGVLKVLGKDALVKWAAQMVARHVYELCILKEAERITGSALMTLLKDSNKLAASPYELRDAKRDLGTAVHTIAELISFGDSVDPLILGADLRPYVLSFVNWWEANKPTVLASEMTVINRTHGYGGTLDMIVDLGGERLVLDIKTSKDTYVDHALQLAAYRHCEFCPVPLDKMVLTPEEIKAERVKVTPNGYEFPMIEGITGGAILVLRPHEAKLMRWECGQDEFEAFLAAKRMYDWTRTFPKPWEASVVPTLMASAVAAAESPE